MERRCRCTGNYRWIGWTPWCTFYWLKTIAKFNNWLLNILNPNADIPTINASLQLKLYYGLHMANIFYGLFMEFNFSAPRFQFIHSVEIIRTNQIHRLEIFSDSTVKIPSNRRHIYGLAWSFCAEMNRIWSIHEWYLHPFQYNRGLI